MSERTDRWRINAPHVCMYSCPDLAEQNESMDRQKSGRRATDVAHTELTRVGVEIGSSHHRAVDAGAGLGVVNALRFASTRPPAGPSGIDDTSARHVSGNCAMVVSVSMTQTRLTGQSQRRMLGSSRRCRTALPPFAATATERAHPVVAPRARAERNPNHGAVRTRQMPAVGRRAYQLGTSRTLAAHRPQDHARRREWRSPGTFHALV